MIGGVDWGDNRLLLGCELGSQLRGDWVLISMFIVSSNHLSVLIIVCRRQTLKPERTDEGIT